MCAVCAPGIFLSSGKVPLWIVLLFICIGKINAGDSERVVGKVGNPFFLHPTKLHGNFYEVRWKTQHRPVGKLINGRLQCESRCKIFPNGSLTMISTNKNDAGIYTMDLFNKDGNNIAARTIRLIVQDDISTPLVHSSCTVGGWVKLTCSLQTWDQVTIRWTVSPNYTLDNAMADKHSLYLQWQTPGHVVCVASNEVSQNSSLPISRTCRARLAPLMALGLFLALPVLAIAILVLKKKHTHVSRKDAENFYVVMHKKTAPPPVHGSSKHDAENCYVVMHKKTASPPDQDVSDYGCK
ncbi:T-cell surface antigen CD2-like isoform X2 [Conger conger]|uniref:T-cell surface antigen CD2-like isoform X2 n=1 Tax=Conger conger TaxID=82655 RepID=UPI002A5A2778|nr:T-cell surface antigen CD2-like isoform X2 [Conger conger]